MPLRAGARREQKKSEQIFRGILGRIHISQDNQHSRTNHQLMLRFNEFRDYYTYRSGMRSTGLDFNVCRKSRVRIKAKSAGFVAERWSMTGVKCRDFTGELLRRDVFVLAAGLRRKAARWGGA